MKNRILLLTAGCVFLLTIVVHAQEKLIDSLRRSTEYAVFTSHEKAMTLTRLADAYSHSNMDTASYLLNEAMSIAKKSNDHNVSSFIFYTIISWYARQDSLGLAQRAVDSCLYYAKSGSDAAKGLAWSGKGYLENLKNKPDSAIASWQKALDYLNAAGNAAAIAAIYYKMYGIYADKNDTIHASAYARLALQEALKSGNPEWIVSTWQINGTDFSDIYSRGKDPKYLDSALYAFRQSVEIFNRQKGWIKDQSVVYLPALNLADLYMDYFPDTKSDTVIKYINISLAAAQSTGNKKGMTQSYLMMAKLNFMAGKLDKAEDALLQEKKIVDAMQSPDYSLSMSMYGALADVAEKKGDLPGALRYYKQYMDNYKELF